MIKGFIFDLDGVLVDTARFHFQAWKRLANSLDIDFTESQNEQLKGVGREDSLKKILEWGNATLSDNEFQSLMLKKNAWYLEMIESMASDDTLPGVKEFLNTTRQLNLKIGLGSASKNARKILDRVEITEYFDVIIDGNQTTKSKPDPQVFSFGAESLDLKPETLVVFEDSQAGVKAANDGGFKSVGIGDKNTLSEASKVYKGLSEVTPMEVINHLNFK